jgi:thiol-disulfide isomerase/thioredoxin
MALQCTQIPIAASIRFDKTLAAPYRKSFLAKIRLQNSNITLQARFLRHCKRDITKQLRQGNTRSVCVQSSEPKPTWIEMTPITGEAQFDEVLESDKPIIIDWMAAWCRKCIYLKPKLEKLSAEYYPDVKFYFVDVNTVPSTLVSRAQVTVRFLKSLALFVSSLFSWRFISGLELGYFNFLLALFEMD